MAQVTIHKDPGVTVEIINGDPPADQSAVVAEQAARIAALQSDLDMANAATAAVSAQRDALQAKIDAARAALA